LIPSSRPIRLIATTETLNSRKRIIVDIQDNIIKANPYFKTLSSTIYSDLIENINIVTLKKHEILFHEGDFADAFYIVKEGAVRITTIDNNGNTIFLARIATGGFFGEQAFSPSSSPRRQATVSAQVDSILYQIPRTFLLHINQLDQKIQLRLEKQNLVYLKEKMHKLANDIQHLTYNISDITENKLHFVKYTVIYMQNEPADKAYILVSGEIELRSYDHHKQLQQLYDINPGQLFGTECFTDDPNNKLVYTHNAIVKHDANVIVISKLDYDKVIKKYPLLSELSASFNREFATTVKGKIFQFRSEYFEMPSTTSIISLTDKREIICQQIISMNIFLAVVSNHSYDNELNYIRDENTSREIRLANNKIIGLFDIGTWEDSYSLLKLMIDEIVLNEAQLKEFTQTGHITIDVRTLDDTETVCKCMRVSRSVIAKLITSGSASNLAEISRKTGAGTVCGGCKPNILEMLGTDAWIPYTITKNITHHAEIKSFQLNPIKQKIPIFKPGQHIIIKAKINDAWVQRNYTLTSTPDLPYLEISVKKESKGIFSPWLFQNANNNHIFYISGPYGEFTADENKNAPIVCIVGGIGVTPAIAFLRYFATIEFNQKIYVDYSVQNPEQFILNKEFELLSEKHQNMIVNHRVTSIQGQITETEIQNIILSIPECHVYVCGPKGLEKLTVDAFRKLNIDPARLHVEQFIHAGAPDNMPQTINLE